MIKRSHIAQHKFFMVLAALGSFLFFASYLYYHFHAGHVRFGGAGALRPIYFSILISHVFLAAFLPFVVPVLLWYAFRSDFARHKVLARWVWPVWMYVSVTGIAVYFLLYVFTKPAV